MTNKYTPKRTNRTPGKLTPEKVEQFLEHLRTGISMAGAARAVGVSHTCVYSKRETDKDFAAACDLAREAGADRMEDALLNLGISHKKPVALMFLLNGRRPEVYRQRMQADLTNSDGSLAGLFAEAMSTGASSAFVDRHDGNGHDRDTGGTQASG